jgi:hypothetical protein
MASVMRNEEKKLPREVKVKCQDHHPLLTHPHTVQENQQMIVTPEMNTRCVVEGTARRGGLLAKGLILIIVLLARMTETTIVEKETIENTETPMEPEIMEGMEQGETGRHHHHDVSILHHLTTDAMVTKTTDGMDMTEEELEKETTGAITEAEVTDEEEEEEEDCPK